MLLAALGAGQEKGPRSAWNPPTRQGRRRKAFYKVNRLLPGARSMNIPGSMIESFRHVVGLGVRYRSQLLRCRGCAPLLFDREPARGELVLQRLQLWLQLFTVR